MATINGTIEFATAGNNKLQGKVDWYATANGPVANNSTVDAIIYARRPDGYGPTTGQSWSGYVKVGSIQQNISLSSSVSVNTSWVEMARITGAIIAHNANGTGSVAISGSVTGPSNTSLANITSSGSGTATLETIPRYFSNTPTITLTSKTETSFNLTWNTSETCSKVVLYVGGEIYSTTNVNAKTGTLTITGKSANTSYAVYGKFTRSDSGLTTNSSTATWTTYQYPYVSGVSVANLKIGSEQTITLYNPLGRSVAVYMKKDNTSGTTLFSQTGATTGTSYSFTPTANTLYGSISNSTSGNAVYYCTYSNHTISSKSGTYSINGTEVPTFSNFTAVDNNSTTTTLTGNSEIVVKGYSNILVTIPVENKAIANNSATMKSYKIQVGTMTAISKDYSSTTNVTATQNNANSNQVSVSAIDSRGLAKTISKTLTIKNYFKPYITDYTATRGNSGTATETTLAFTINFWNESFGNSHNSIRTIGYKYKESGASQWTTGTTTLTYTTSGNKATGSVVVNGDTGASGFTLGTAFDIQIFMTDALDSASSTALLLSGTPSIAIAGNKVGIGMPVKTSLNASLQVNGNLALLDGELDGTATRSKELLGYYETRPTSANLTANGSGGLKTFKATDSMTTGKPPGNSHIIHLSWDNTNGYDSQIAVRNDGDDPKLWIRSQTAGTWKNWVELIRATEFNLLGTYTKVTGTYKTGAWSAGTVTNCTWTAPRDGKYIMWMYFQPQSDSTAYLYKQLQARGTATRPMGDILFYQGGPTSGGTSDRTVIAINCSFPVEATAGQTIYPYVHTPTANLVWNVAITGMYVGR